MRSADAAAPPGAARYAYCQPPAVDLSAGDDSAAAAAYTTPVTAASATPPPTPGGAPLTSAVTPRLELREGEPPAVRDVDDRIPAGRPPGGAGGEVTDVDHGAILTISARRCRGLRGRRCPS